MKIREGQKFTSYICESDLKSAKSSCNLATNLYTTPCKHVNKDHMCRSCKGCRKIVFQIVEHKLKEVVKK